MISRRQAVLACSRLLARQLTNLSLQSSPRATSKTSSLHVLLPECPLYPSRTSISVRYTSTSRKTKNISQISPTATPPRPATRTRRLIESLDPAHLRPSDFHDISGEISPIYRHPTITDHTAWAPRYYSPRISPAVPFPPNTHGFLYYTSLASARRPVPDNLTSELGKIRFRITPSSDPSSFAQGKDLLMPNGLTWHTVPRAPYNYRNGRPSFLWKLLLRDGLVSDSITYNHKQRHSSDDLTRFGQPFPVKFAGLRFTHTVRLGDMGQESTAKETAQLNIRNPLRPLLATGVEGPSLYCGSALCCFEKFVDLHHPSKRSVVIRVLKILEPAKALVQLSSKRKTMPDAPVEGELLPATSSRHKWIYSLEDAADRKSKGGTARGIEILFENEMLEQKRILG